MKRIISLTLTLLATGFAAHAKETAQSVDLKMQLVAHIIACDTAAFETSWKSYQETTSANELSTTRAQLTQIATQLKNTKEQERTQKLGDKWGRGLAGLCGIITAYPLAFMGMGIFEETSKAYRSCSRPKADLVYLGPDARATFDFQKFMRKLYKNETSLLVLTASLLTHYAIQQIQYARFAGTEQLTAEITALDAIIAVLTPEQTQITQTQN